MCIHESYYEPGIIHGEDDNDTLIVAQSCDNDSDIDAISMYVKSTMIIIIRTSVITSPLISTF